MIKIDYFVRAFVKNDEKCQVAIRVRWNDKRSKTTFITRMRAGPDKWDKDGQKAMRRTVHVVKRRKFTAEEINERINDFKQEIEAAFDAFAVQNRIPSVSELHDVVNEGIGRKEIETAQQTLIKKKQ